MGVAKVRAGACWWWKTHGDGVRFKGRTYIQITGRAKLHGDQQGARLGRVLDEVDARRARLRRQGCNQIADTGDFVALTRRINGGTNGLASRQAYYRRARLVARFLVPKRRKP